MYTRRNSIRLGFDGESKVHSLLDALPLLNCLIDASTPLKRSTLPNRLIIARDKNEQVSFHYELLYTDF